MKNVISRKGLCTSGALPRSTCLRTLPPFGSPAAKPYVLGDNAILMMNGISQRLTVPTIPIRYSVLVLYSRAAAAVNETRIQGSYFAKKGLGSKDTGWKPEP